MSDATVGQVYSHRNGEVAAPDWEGHYWVKVERLQDWSTGVCFEIWERGHSRWVDFGDVNDRGAVGKILAIYGPIPQPRATPAAAQGASVPSDILQTLHTALTYWRAGMEFDEERMHVDIALTWLAQQRGQG